MKLISEFISQVLNVDWRYHLFKKTGYSFYTEETSGKTIEFIGTSGIGKTTLFRNTMIRLRSRWIFAHHLDFIKRTTPPCETDEILMKILERRIAKIYSSESFCPWHSLLDIKLSVQVMAETMKLASQSGHPTGFALDEGLFRHFPAEILQLVNELPAQLWKDRAFVYLRARIPETALSRIKSRTMSLAKIERQRVRTDDQILSSILKDQEMFQSIVDRATSFGCPVVVIDAEEPIQDSINKVLDFESSLNQKFKMQEKMKTAKLPLTIKG